MKASEVMNPIRDLDAFTRAYVECALWSELDEDGVPLDSNYSWTDIAPHVLQKMMDDCKAFQAAHGDEIVNGCLTDLDAWEQAGHDLWLTRNGHGCGFWETSDWQEEIGARLDIAAKAMGECNLYVGDDGRIS